LAFVGKQGFNTGKAVLGVGLFGALGLAGGSQGQNDPIFHCNKCGRKGRIEIGKG
jgi:hypothetical protein